jgi:hypothetical protein
MSSSKKKYIFAIDHGTSGPNLGQRNKIQMIGGME